MLQAVLVDTMGAEELQYWIAYDCIKDEEFRKSIVSKVNIDLQKEMTEQQTQHGLRAFLSSIGKRN